MPYRPLAAGKLTETGSSSSGPRRSTADRPIRTGPIPDVTISTYTSGFPDEHAFETWLLRLAQLAEAEHGNQRFAGRVLTTGRQARDLLANPALQIHPGTGMTCVFDPDRAQCRLRDGAPDVRVTPDLTDCRPSCQNIARADRDIGHLRQQTTELEALVNDPLAPAPRTERERHELARLQAIVADHDHTNPGTTP